MGFSISEEQYERIMRLLEEGRRCAMSTRNGGCYNRATWRERHEWWLHNVGEGESKIGEMVFCTRHHSQPGAGGRNFRVISSERY